MGRRQERMENKMMKKKKNKNDELAAISQNLELRKFAKRIGVKPNLFARRVVEANMKLKKTGSPALGILRSSDFTLPAKPLAKEEIEEHKSNLSADIKSGNINKNDWWDENGANWYESEGPGAVKTWTKLLTTGCIGVSFRAKEWLKLVDDADEGYSKQLARASVDPETIRKAIREGGTKNFYAVLCDAWATDIGRLANLNCSDEYPIRSVWLIDFGPDYNSFKGNKRVARLDTTRETFNKVVSAGALRTDCSSEWENILGRNLEKRLSKRDELRAEGWAI
jgi:hypothetical protein